MSKKLLFILSLFFPVLLFGGNRTRIDSLTRILAITGNDTVKCRVLAELFKEYTRTDLDRAALYDKQLFELAEKMGDKRWLTTAINNKSGEYRLRGQNDSALAIMERSRKIFHDQPDSTIYADYLGELANLYTNKNDVKNAMTCLVQSLQYYRQMKNKKNLALLYNRFGALYMSQKQYDSALYYYNKSLEVNIKNGFKLGSSANLINIGNVNEAKLDRRGAIDCYQKALIIKEELKDKRGIGLCMNNIGTSYMNLGEVAKAVEYHEKAIKLAGEYKSDPDIAMGLINLGFDYQKGADYRKAVKYTLEGYLIAKQINDLKLLRESSRVLAECYGSLGVFRDAYNYQVLYKKYSDSIVNEKNLKTLTEIRAKYDMVTKEKEIATLMNEKNEQKLKIQSMRGWYFLGSGLFVIVLLVALFFYYRARVSRRLSNRLREINEMKSHFFANLSHEFRTPLTLMMGPAEKLLETANPDQKPWLELIHRNASRLLFLDEQLLEFTKIDSGIQKIRLVSGNIIQPLRSIADSFIPLAEKKDLRFSFSFTEETINALFDSDILQKVISNLLSNAFKYTPAGGTVELFVSRETRPVLPGNPVSGGESEYVRMDVADTGIGIPENKKELVFERFFQLNHNPGNTTGVGIGLALTRELLKIHRGFIILESAEGKGSVFSVSLPLNRSVYTEEELLAVKPYLQVLTEVPDDLIPEGPVPAEPGDEVDLSGQDGSQPSVLVVDDNADMRTYLLEVLRPFYTLYDAGDAIEGFEIACNIIPDIVITDVMMHPVDGKEFCSRLKQDERTSHIPVIMLTALSDTTEKVRGLETGADDYITKPFSISELKARIINLITQRQKLRQLFSSVVSIEPKAISVTSADERFLQKLMVLIEQNIDNPELDTEFLLTHISMSRSQLHRKVKALSGQPITGFIRIMRIKRAAQLMEQKFGNVSEIMYAVGFNNLSYFTKCFREVYHVTPSDYMAK